MNKLLVGVALLGAYVTGKMMSESKLSKPVSRVSIIMPAYNEEEDIEVALNSLLNQNVVRAYPQLFEMVVVDDLSTDSTAEIAAKYATKVYRNKNKGILNAKKIAIEKSAGDIIVSTNADTYYPDGWLNNMLLHFKDPYVVGVSSPVFYHSFKLLNGVMMFWSPYEQRFSGASSAFRKDAFYMSGGYNTNIDQTSGKEVQYEEEFGFKTRLSRVGKVSFEWKPVYTSGRRHKCNLTDRGGQYCNEMNKGERFSKEVKV